MENKLTPKQALQVLNRNLFDLSINPYAYKNFEEKNESFDIVEQALTEPNEYKKIEERIPLKDIERILDATFIYAKLTDGFHNNDVETTLEIEKVTSTGLWLKKNDYGISFAPFKDYKEGWALTKKELL